MVEDLRVEVGVEGVGERFGAFDDGFNVQGRAVDDDDRLSETQGFEGIVGDHDSGAVD